jgi:hypothetical protein
MNLRKNAAPGDHYVIEVLEGDAERAGLQGWIRDSIQLYISRVQGK